MSPIYESCLLSTSVWLMLQHSRRPYVEACLTLLIPHASRCGAPCSAYWYMEEYVEAWVMRRAWHASHESCLLNPCSSCFSILLLTWLMLQHTLSYTNMLCHVRDMTHRYETWLMLQHILTYTNMLYAVETDPRWVGICSGLREKAHWSY